LDARHLLAVGIGAVAFLGAVAAAVLFLVYPRLDFHSFTPAPEDVQRSVPVLHRDQWQYRPIYGNRQVDSWLFRVVDATGEAVAPAARRSLEAEEWQRYDEETWHRESGRGVVEVIRVAELNDGSALIGYIRAERVQNPAMPWLLDSDPQFLWAKKFFWPKYYAARTFYGE